MRPCYKHGKRVARKKSGRHGCPKGATTRKHRR